MTIDPGVRETNLVRPAFPVNWSDPHLMVSCKVILISYVDALIAATTPTMTVGIPAKKIVK